MTFKIPLEIEQTIDMRQLMEERILGSRVKFTIREIPRIAKKEFQDVIIDLMMRKR